MGQAQQGPQGGAEGGPGEEDGDDLAPPESGAQGEGGKENFQQEGLGNGLPRQHAADNGVARPVVVLVAHQQGEGQHQRAAHGGPEDGVGEKAGVQLGGQVHGLAEKHGHGGAQSPQGRRLDDGSGRQESHGADLIARVGVQAAELGQHKGGDGGGGAGHQGSVVHHAHAHHLHGEDGGGERGAEQGGEGGGHAAHHHDPAVLLVQADVPAHPGGQGTAQLQRGPFTSGGAAHQVGEDGGQEDEGGGAQLHGLGLPHGGEHQVGAPVLLHAADAIDEHDGGPAQRQEKHHPGELAPQMGAPVDAQMKGHRHAAHQQADAAGVQHPL